MLTAILVDGISYGVILFIIAVGLSITMGLIRVVNMAHSGFAMMGGFAAAAFIAVGLPFELAMVVAVLFVAAISLPIERFLMRPVYGKSELEQALMTIGLVYVIIAASNSLFGATVTSLTFPSYVTGPITIFGHTAAKYRIVLIGAGVLIAFALWFFLERSTFGLKVRAAVDDASTAQTVGINTSRLYAVAFACGAGMAALGGVLGSQMMPMEPSYALKYLILVLAVVTVGGLGSIMGTFAAALLLGLLDTAAKYLLPEVAATAFYLTMFVVLIIRPQGLFGRGA